MKTYHRSDIDECRKMLKNAPPADFDGHTEFVIMTPEERLMWLSQSAQFSAEFILANERLSD